MSRRRRHSKGVRVDVVHAWQCNRESAKISGRESMNEIVTLAESLIPLISELRHTTENDRRIADSGWSRSFLIPESNE